MITQAESSRKHYLKNRVARRADIVARKAKNKEFIQQYKWLHPCKCGESEPCCLDFHHKDPSTKFDVIPQMANRGLGLKRILEEIAKCEVLCSNCHRKLHFGRVVLIGNTFGLHPNIASSNLVSSTNLRRGGNMTCIR